MFHKLCTLALVAPLASALIFQTPENPTSGGQIKVTWIHEPNDPAIWDLGLINGVIRQAFLLANNLDPSVISVILTLPDVPVGSGYAFLAFVDHDFNKNFATSSVFSIGPVTSSTDSGSSTTSSATSSSTTALSTTSSPTSSPPSSSTTSLSTNSSSTTPSLAGSSLTPQASFTGNSITATPSSSSTSSGGLTPGEIAGLASSIPIGVLGLIIAIIAVWYARKQALAGKPVLSALKDDMARFRHHGTT